jgi:hypothetical protein
MRNYEPRTYAHYLTFAVAAKKHREPLKAAYWLTKAIAVKNGF